MRGAENRQLAAAMQQHTQSPEHVRSVDVLHSPVQSDRGCDFRWNESNLKWASAHEIAPYVYAVIHTSRTLLEQSGSNDFLLRGVCVK